MQKIEFTNNFFIKEKLNVTDGFCIILGNNCSGKTSILNTLENGFKGKLIDFLVDENPVKSDSYQVVFLNENSFLKENLKLTKNSFLKQLFGLKLNQEKWNNNASYNEINIKLQELGIEINTLIQNKLFNDIYSVINPYINIQGKVNTLSLETIIDKFLKIYLYYNEVDSEIEPENYSIFLLRTLLFKMLENTLNKDKLRHIIFIIDLPELYGTPKSWFKFNQYLNKFQKLNNALIVIVSNSPHYLSILKPPIESFNIIKDKKIIKFTNLKKKIIDVIALLSFLKSEKADDLISYKNDFFSVFDFNDIKIETDYFYREIYNDLIFSLFSEEIIIGTFICNGYEFISQEKYFYLIKCDLKKCIFLIFFLKLVNFQFLLTNKIKLLIKKISFYFDDEIQ